MLAFSLTPIPNILLLDEPISGIDHNGVADFWNVINEIRLVNDIAIIIVSHDFGQVKKYANTVALLDKTVLKTAPPKEMFESEEFKGVFNV
jgi:zinc transport system ATP-binding protein